MEKSDLRKLVSKKIKNMGLPQMDFESGAVCKKILSGKEYIDADLVFSYMAMDNEINPMEISRQALADKKALYLPRTEKNGNQMDFYFMENLQSNLEKGRWGILEPSVDCKKLDLNSLENKKILMIVPGVAFTKSGKRLGHGMGFYDIYIERLKRALSKKSSLFLMAVCFSCQILDEGDLICEDHDILMDKVVFNLHESQSLCGV